MYTGMKKKVLILLSGFMIGSTLFAVPKKRNIRDDIDLFLMTIEWISARPRGERRAEYFDRMEKAAWEEEEEDLLPEERFERIKKKEKLAKFPLDERVSQTFLSMLNYYLPGHPGSPNAQQRKMIAECVKKFRRGEANVATIKQTMFRFCRRANRDRRIGRGTFAHNANGCVILNLVLYELERLIGIVQ